MSVGWSSDFSYSYFRAILQVVKSDFKHFMIFQAPQVLAKDSDQPIVFLRHDIDVDLNKAMQMANIENDFAISATYYVMINSPLYQAKSRSARSVLMKLISMGHEIGLHFDFDSDEERRSFSDIHSLEPKINLACERLESIICQPIRSISFHRPLPQLLRGSLMLCRRVNAYCRELMTWYLSDSNGNWREGEPLPMLLAPRQPLLQLLIHPIWWGDEHMSPESRLNDFVKVTTRRYSSQRSQIFETSLFNHIDFRRTRM
jgi:hypothetical protein